MYREIGWGVRSRDGLQKAAVVSRGEMLVPGLGRWGDEWFECILKGIC